MRTNLKVDFSDKDRVKNLGAKWDSARKIWYIEKTQQLSHSIEGKNDLFDLILRVNPAAIFHFQERPLGKSQKINQPTENDSWYLVSTQVPYTVLLVPFLLSMGPWVEIISPEKIKSEFISRLRVMQEIYIKDLSPIN